MAKIENEFTDYINQYGFDKEAYAFDSSVIKFATYNDCWILRIRFTSGKDYTYDDVPPEVWEEFVEAESQGKYFNEHIRGEYSFVCEYAA